MMLIREAEGRAILSDKRRFSVFISRECSDYIAVYCIVGSIGAVALVGLCRIQFKLHTFQRFAVLVYLFNAVVEGGLEVEAHLQAGIVVPALQIKHLQAVVGAGGENLFSVILHPVHRIRLILSQGGYKPFI